MVGTSDELEAHPPPHDAQGMVDAWLDFALGELEPPLMLWVLPLLGVWPDSHQKEEAAAVAVSRVLRALDAHLSLQSERLSSDYAVGCALSLADVALVCSLALCTSSTQTSALGSRPWRATSRAALAEFPAVPRPCSWATCSCASGGSCTWVSGATLWVGQARGL